MDVEALYKIQHALDQKITEKHRLHGMKLIDKKILALQVELGELANETRCFKFWSVKSASARPVILEEYVDALHFVLSIGLEAGFQHKVILTWGDFEESGGEQELTAAFLKAYDQIATFARQLDLAAYLDMFKAILSLGHALGFSWPEIKQAYLQKNEVNHLRQEHGY